MKKILIVTLLSLIGLMGHAKAEKFAIVVNAENAANYDANEVKRIFLKEKTKWESGENAVPFLGESGSDVQNGLVEKIFGMTSAELEKHWLVLQQKSGTTPPRAIGSSKILKRQISRKAGAVGIMKASDVAGDDAVRVLYEFEN